MLTTWVKLHVLLNKITQLPKDKRYMITLAYKYSLVKIIHRK